MGGRDPEPKKVDGLDSTVGTLFVGPALHDGHFILQTLDNQHGEHTPDNHCSHEGQTILKESHVGTGRVHLTLPAVAREARCRERTSAGDCVSIVI